MNKKLTIILVILNIALMAVCIKYIIDNNEHRQGIKNDEETMAYLREENIKSIKEMDEKIANLEAMLNR